MKKEFIKIAGQELEKMRGDLKVIFPDMTDFTSQNDIFVVTANGKTIGYAFTAKGNGYGGPIQILVALQDAKTVKAISVLSQTETSGLGSRITLLSFASQFAGKNINDIKLKSEGGQIDGFTGSTISSKAAVNAVRETALQKVAQFPK